MSLLQMSFKYCYEVIYIILYYKFYIENALK